MPNFMISWCSCTVLIQLFLMADKLAFTERLLQTMEWSYGRYQFDFFLRIDDDHFLCLDRLLYELNFRPKKALYWGFVHCRPKIVRVDEAWLILTRDLIEEVLDKRNTTLLCSPYGDQAVALWMGESSKNVTYFMDNQRIIHKSAVPHKSVGRASRPP